MNYHLLALTDEEYDVMLWALNLAAGRYEAGANRYRASDPEYHMNMRCARQVRDITASIEKNQREVTR